MDNDIFLGMVKYTVLLWLLQWFCVLMLKCNFVLQNNNNNDVKAKIGLDNDNISWPV